MGLPGIYAALADITGEGAAITSIRDFTDASSTLQTNVQATMTFISTVMTLTSQ